MKSVDKKQFGDSTVLLLISHQSINQGFFRTLLNISTLNTTFFAKLRLKRMEIELLCQGEIIPLHAHYHQNSTIKKSTE